MSFRPRKPNRFIVTLTRTDNDPVEPVRKPYTHGDPDTCLKCPYKECKRGWCDRMTKI